MYQITPLSIWLGFLNSKVYQTHQMAKKLALSGSIYYDRPEKKSRLFCLALLECIVLYSLLHDWFSKLGYTEVNGKLFCCEKHCALNYNIIYSTLILFVLTNFDRNLSSLLDKSHLLFVMKGYMLNQTDNLLNNSITYSFLHGRKGCFGDFMQQKIQICLYLRLLAEWAKNIALIPSNFSMKQQKNVNLIRPPYVRTTAPHHRSGMWLLRK